MNTCKVAVPQASEAVAVGRKERERHPWLSVAGWLALNVKSASAGIVITGATLSTTLIIWMLSSSSASCTPLSFASLKVITEFEHQSKTVQVRMILNVLSPASQTVKISSLLLAE